MEQTLRDLMSEANKRGLRILGTNAFGIVYEDNDNTLHLLKLTPIKNKVDIMHIAGFTGFGIARHFISLGYLEEPWKDIFSQALFVKNSRTNLIGRFRQSSIQMISNDGIGSKAGQVCGEFEVICFEANKYNGIYAVNYLGKKINMSDYSERYYNIGTDLAILKDSDTYKIGYSDQSKSEKLYNGSFRYKKIDHTIMRTDKDFSNVEYTRCKTRGYKHT